MPTSQLQKAAGLVLMAAAFFPIAIGLAEPPLLAEGGAQDGKTAPQADEARRLGSVHFRHGNTVFFVAYVAEDKQLVTASHDLTLRLWDAATGQEIRRFERTEGAGKIDPAEEMPGMAGGMMMQMTPDGSPQAAFPVAVSPDGKSLAALLGGTIHLWDVATGKRRHAWKFNVEVDAGNPLMKRGLPNLVFSRDGQTLGVSTSGDKIATWDVTTGKSETKPKNPAVGKRAAGPGEVLSPDGKYAAWNEFDETQQNMSIKVKDLQTGKQVADLPLTGGDGKNLTFSPDSKTLAWCLSRDGIRLYEIGKDAEPRTLGRAAKQGKRINSFCFAPDGNKVALHADDRTIQLWDVKANQLIGELGEPERAGGRSGVIVVAGRGTGTTRNDDAAFSRDGKTLAAALGGSIVRQFDAATGKEIALAEAGHRKAVSGLQLSPDGKTLTTAAARDAVRMWDLAQNKELKKLPLTPLHRFVALSPDGRRAYAAKAGTIEVYDVASAERVSQFKVSAAAIGAMTVSPDGRALAVRAMEGGRVQLWDTATGKMLLALDDDVPTGNRETVRAITSGGSTVSTGDLVFSPDGRFVAGCDANRRLCLWDRATGTRMWDGAEPGQPMQRFAFAADGRMLAVLRADGTVALVETSTGQRRATLGQGRPKVQGPLTFAVVLTAKPPTFDDSSANPNALVFSPDGRYLATSHTESSVHLWDVLGASEMGRLTGHQGGITGLLFAADGKRLISGSVDTTAMVSDVARKTPAPPADEEPVDFKGLLADFTGKDAAKAYAALRQLVRHPAEAVRMTRDLAKPVPAPDSKRIDLLLVHLTDGKFDVRRQAMAELEKYGDVILPALKEAHGRESTLEGRQRLEILLKKLSNPVNGGTVVRDLRVVELLELVGSDEARQALRTLADGAAGARLTEEAQGSLARLARRS